MCVKSFGLSKKFYYLCNRFKNKLVKIMYKMIELYFDDDEILDIFRRNGINVG